MHTHMLNAVTLVWDSLRLAPVIVRSLQKSAHPLLLAQFLVLGILDRQNFCQKLQALAVIEIIHQKKALSEICQTITIGTYVVANSIDVEATCVFHLPQTNFN